MIRLTIPWLAAAALLGSCRSTSDPNPMTFEDRDWELVELFGEMLPDEIEETPWIRFDAADLRVHGSTGINRFNGGYERDGDVLHVGALAMTRRAGAPEAMRVEMTFVTALEQTAGFSIDGRELLLRGEKFEPVAGFKGR